VEVVGKYQGVGGEGGDGAEIKIKLVE